MTTNSVVIGAPPIEIALRRRAGARRLSLSVSMIDGRARLTAPDHCDAGEIRRFLERHETWLRQATGRAAGLEPIELGKQMPFRGVMVTLRPSVQTGVTPDLDDGVIWIGTGRAPVGRRVVARLREEARARLLARSRFHAEALGVSFTSLSIRDTRSRWGSCSSSGALSYSWRLIMAPDDVLDYVAAHEVAHLREMNHSSRFWAEVEKLRPDWRRQRDWLKRHGAELHRYQPVDGPDMDGVC
ncbi:MAG: M48 family metallopeptidase [Neomegalonema sp.]|nr:M48 family metallopeptidase [Neomegalonema sp.]